MGCGWGQSIGLCDVHDEAGGQGWGWMWIGSMPGSIQPAKHLMGRQAQLGRGPHSSIQSMGVVWGPRTPRRVDRWRRWKTKSCPAPDPRLMLGASQCARGRRRQERAKSIRACRLPAATAAGCYWECNAPCTRPCWVEVESIDRLGTPRLIDAAAIIEEEMREARAALVQARAGGGFHPAAAQQQLLAPSASMPSSFVRRVDRFEKLRER